MFISVMMLSEQRQDFLPPQPNKLSYADLRDDEDINMKYLRRKFSDFPEKFYNALMELREL